MEIVGNRKLLEAGGKDTDDLHRHFSGKLDPVSDRVSCPDITAKKLEFEMKSFGKQPDCPTSRDMLSYVEGSLRPLARQRIQHHCVICDFCGAEAQLLATHTPYKNDYTPARTTTLVTLLGVKVPINLQTRQATAIETRRAA